jgi:hypothetical protein
MDGHAEVTVPTSAEQQANGADVHVESAAAPEQQQAQPSQVSDEEVKQRLMVLLGKSDLTQTTGDCGWLTAAAAGSRQTSPLTTKLAFVRTQRRCFVSSWRRT